MAAVGGLTALVNLAIVAKELLVANRFGVCDQMDAFVLALMLPSFASSVVGFSFNAAFIPTYISIREKEGLEAAQKLFSSTLVFALLLLIVVAIVLGLLFPAIVSLLRVNFGPEKLSLTRSLFLIMLATIVLRGALVIYGSVLNASDRYALAATTPALTPVCMLAMMLCLSGRIGVYSLSLGMVVGMALESVILATGLKRAGLAVLPRWYGYNEPLKQVIGQYVPMIAGACLGSSSTIVDQSFASTLGSGSLSALSYANKVVVFMLSVCATAVSTAVMPHFCRLVAQRDWQGIRRSIRSNLRIIVSFTVLITAGLFLGSELVVRILFQRGAFTSGDTHLVAHVQQMYVLQIPFYVTSILIVRLISSMQGNAILMRGAALNVVVNIVLDYILMKRMGVAGIALSTTGVYAISLVYCSIALRRRIARLSAESPVEIPEPELVSQ